MSRVIRDQTAIITAATASDLTKRVVLPRQGSLVHVTFGSTANPQAPVYVVLDVTIQANQHLLKTGWARGSDTPTAEGISWHGRLPLGGDYETAIRFTVANDTGTNFFWQGSWLVEL